MKWGVCCWGYVCSWGSAWGQRPAQVGLPQEEWGPGSARRCVGTSSVHPQSFWKAWVFQPRRGRRRGGRASWPNPAWLVSCVAVEFLALLQQQQQQHR